jgi:hypothetical protein
MKARALRSFESQKYNCELVVFEDHSGMTIGAMRNAANAQSKGQIIAHWDEDDLSHPNRIQEQVALLQASGADCVGYNECLFWDTRYICLDCKEPIGEPGYSCDKDEPVRGKAWLYRDPCPREALGSSMLYWRSVWDKYPFDDINHGEDTRLQAKCKTLAVSANRTLTGFVHPNCFADYMRAPNQFTRHENDCDPRMICSIHGANTSVYAPEKDRNMWKRAADFDAYCERTMRL